MGKNLNDRFSNVNLKDENYNSYSNQDSEDYFAKIPFNKYDFSEQVPLIEVIIILSLSAFLLLWPSLFCSTDSFKNSDSRGWYFFIITFSYLLYNYFISFKFYVKEKMKNGQSLKEVLNSEADIFFPLLHIFKTQGSLTSILILSIAGIIGAFLYETDVWGFWEIFINIFFYYFLIWIIIAVLFFFKKETLFQKGQKEKYNYVLNLGRLAILYFPLIVIWTGFFIGILEGD